MQALVDLPSTVRCDLKVVDLGSVTGWLKSKRTGVRKAPTVVIDGCCFNGGAVRNTLMEMKNLAI
jgi:hypothetical protein